MSTKTARLHTTRHAKSSPTGPSAGPQQKKSKTGLRLPKHLQKDVRAEAKALGLTNEEYLRLLLALSKSLRQGLLKKQNIDAKALLQLAESPIFGGLIQYVADSAGNLTTSNDKETATSDESEQNQQPPGNTPVVQPPQSIGIQPHVHRPQLPHPQGNFRPPQWAPPQGPFQPRRPEHPAQRPAALRNPPVRAYLPQG